jgi:AcrR family transcriptional regulator
VAAKRKPDTAVVLQSNVGSSIKDAAALAAGRERLLKGARACFARKGFGGTSVQDIANAAGISVGSLYKYVRAKEDLLYLMAEGSYARLNEVITRAFTASDDPREALCAVVGALIRNADEDRDLVNLLYAEFKYLPAAGRKLILGQEEAIVNGLVETIDRGNELGVFDCQEPRLTAVDLEVSGSFWVLKKHLIGLPLEAYIERRIVVALRMVGARQAAE